MQKNSYPRALAFVIFFCVALVTLGADLASKAWFFDGSSVHFTSRFSFFDGRVQHMVHTNLGAAFNIPLPLPLIIGVSIIFCGWLLVFLFSIPSNWGRPRLVSFFGLLFGGALGNLSDRLALGFVRDWLLLWNRTFVNIADIAILLGFLLALPLLLFSRRQEARPV